MKIFYFSATGNSLHVAKSLGGELISIARCMREEKLDHHDEAIGFVFPIYFGALPEPVVRFLQQGHFSARYLFAVATYGHTPAAALWHFRQLLIKQNLHVDYAAQVGMVDNWLPMYDVAKEMKNVVKRSVEARIARICADIQARRCRPVRFNPFQWLLTAVETWMPGRNICRKFYVRPSCTLCGTCSKLCPAQNISSNSRLIFGAHCVSCLACVHNCPQRAIHIKGERTAVRYRHPAITLSELLLPPSTQMSQNRD